MSAAKNDPPQESEPDSPPHSSPVEAPIEAQRGSRRDRERAFSGLPGRVLGWCGLGLSSLYLANLGLGAGFEFLPDVLPFVGNLDEAGATALLLWSWHALSGDPPRADGP